MKILQFETSMKSEVVQLFTSVFSESEGDSEGRIIGDLVSNLIADTDSNDLIGFVAQQDDQIIGGIFYSRFVVPSKQVSFILSPVAIASSQQGRGVGQKLIKHGLNHLKASGVELVFTYGDPSFYRKVGFIQISEDVVKAPYTLSQPIGWLAQSLVGNPIKPMTGTTSCVKALSDQSYW